MDRNTGTLDPKKYDRVALRKESVDRNIIIYIKKQGRKLSLSARRAWIEIGYRRSSPLASHSSLSARRAWIEMLVPELHLDGISVALRKESVDRNSDNH